MSYLLDTNIIIAALNGHVSVVERLNSRSSIASWLPMIRHSMTARSLT